MASHNGQAAAAATNPSSPAVRRHKTNVPHPPFASSHDADHSKDTATTPPPHQHQPQHLAVVSPNLERRPSSFAAADSAAGFMLRSTTRIGAHMRSMWANITVEPLLLFYIVPCVLTNLAVLNLNLDKACRVNFNYAADVCDALMRRETANYTMEEQEVQKLVARMINWKTILQSGLPGFMILFWGSWSDRHGRRKPCMLFPIVGEVITIVMLIVCVYIDHVRLEVVNLVETLFIALSGGWFNMMLGVFSYVADVTTEEERTFRIGIVNLCITLGIPIGMAFSGILLQQLGFYGVFALALAMHISTLCYGVFRVRESAIRAEMKSDLRGRGLVADFFDRGHIVDTFRVVFKDGPKKRRVRVITLLVALMVTVGPMYGEMAVFYLFTRYRFNWSEVEFSVFSTYSTITCLLGIMFSMAVFSKKLKLDDSIVALISSTSKILSSFVYAFAQTSWHLYLAPVVEMFNGTSFIALRSIASKLVNSDELGKVNSLLSVAEAFMPVIYAPLYANIYSITMDVLPGAFFLMGGAMTLPAIAIYLWMYYIQKSVDRDSENENEADKSVEMGITSATATATSVIADPPADDDDDDVAEPTEKQTLLLQQNGIAGDASSPPTITLSAAPDDNVV